MPDPFLAGLEANAELRGVSAAHAFEATAVLKLLEYAGIDPPRYLKKDSEFGFDWFRENFPTFPVYMEAKHKEPLDLIDVFEAFSKTKPWAALMAIIDNYGASQAGVIVRATAGDRKMPGLWVLHTGWALPSVGGQPRLTYRAKANDRGVIVERLESFILSVKRSGWVV
jgi:hypothetical protein